MDTLTSKAILSVNSFTLFLISFAALFVNVTANMLYGLIPCSKRYAILYVITLVLPVPAPAKIISGPSVCKTASFCELFKFSNDTCATNIIDMLFKTYVDDDTLVVTTGSEHHSVRNNLKNCKHVLDFVIHGQPKKIDIIKEIRPFKKVFVYMIAMSVGDDHYLNNCIVEYLKTVLEEQHKEYTIVLDAVQELFLLPRDYSIYDHIVGTAHALIPNYNMGMLFSKELSVEHNSTWLKGFNDRLELMLNHRGLLYQFNNVMTQYFSKYTVFDSELSDTSNAPFVYNLVDSKKRLSGINEFDDDKGALIPADYTPVTFRACPFIVLPEKFFDKVHAIEYVLDEAY